jgi:hypothetical protein
MKKAFMVARVVFAYSKLFFCGSHVSDDQPPDASAYAQYGARQSFLVDPVIGYFFLKS